MKFPVTVIIIILLISSLSIATAQEKVIVGHSARAALSIGPLLYGIERGFYRDVESYPARQVSVEVACALEGLNDAYSIAHSSHDERAEGHRRCICTGLKYLLELQCTDAGTEKERGGFGMSLSERTQRIDITGHVASAFMKSAENGIESG